MIEKIKKTLEFSLFIPCMNKKPQKTYVQIHPFIYLINKFVLIPLNC